MTPKEKIRKEVLGSKELKWLRDWYGFHMISEELDKAIDLAIEKTARAIKGKLLEKHTAEMTVLSRIIDEYL